MNKINITVEPTNNENIVKFVANSTLSESKSYEFNNNDEAIISPISQQLFQLPFVKTVYISHNFIAIDKHDIVQWNEVQDIVAESISEYINSGKPVISEDQNKKLPVTIYAESTPNPSVIKFVANKPLVNGLFEFKTSQEAENAPLAMELFKFPFVKEVFISSNYLSITKNDSIEWQEIVMELREFIRIYLESGKIILDDAKILNKDTSSVETGKKNQVSGKKLSSIDKKIIALLDEYVKPAVASDGGHIAFDSYDEKSQTVRVILQGACSGCPSSTITLKNGIETMLKEMLQGEVRYVEAING